MKVLKISELNNLDYSISVVNALKQYWRSHNTFSCLNTPKNVNMMLYLDGCSARYTDKKGNVLTARSGNIVYNPIGSEYTVTFFDFQNKNSNTIGVNFFLYDACGVPFILSNDILVFSFQDKSYQILFNRIDAASERVFIDYAQMKAGMYSVLSSICEISNLKRFDKYSIISKGILYLEEHSDQNLPISEIAALCNVSEIYFRKLFKEYSGMSPVEYRIQHKLMHAKLYLEYENMSIAEIADKLSFTSTSYFIKIFKRYTGMTPLQYRNSCPHVPL